MGQVRRQEQRYLSQLRLFDYDLEYDRHEIQCVSHLSFLVKFCQTHSLSPARWNVRLCTSAAHR
jgi:hypothetical protein